MKDSGLFTSRGMLLIKVVEQPGITIKELAESLFLTKRSIWGIVGGLHDKGYLRIVRKGRRHYYYPTLSALEELRELTEVKWGT